MCDDCQNTPKREGQNVDTQKYVLRSNFFFRESLFLMWEMIRASETIDSCDVWLCDLSTPPILNCCRKHF